MILLFENCQPLAKMNFSLIPSSSSSSPAPSSNLRSGGNGEGYGGKLTFYVGASDTQISLAQQAINNPVYLVNPSLPNGLTLNVKTGVISGTPTTVSSSYQSYTLNITDQDTKAELTVSFLLGVGYIYDVSARIDGLGETDAVLDDHICADKQHLCSFRAALDQAAKNPVKTRIKLPAKTYLINIGKLLISTDVEIMGSGRTFTILSGGDKNLVLNVTAADATFKDLSIVHGKNTASELAGGLQYQNVHGALELDNVDVSFNVTDNITSTGAAGIYFAGQNLFITNSYIHNNSALSFSQSFNKSGGGIFIGSGFAVIKDSFIEDNSTNESGGGIYSDYPQNLALQNVVLARNSSFGKGGGIFAGLGGHISILQSSLIENVSQNDEAGGIYWVPQSLGNLFIENTTFAKNQATDGAALSISTGCSVTNDSITIRSSTFAENSASSATGGGAVRMLPGGGCHIQLVNSIIATNSPQSCSLEAAAINPIVSAGLNIDAGLSCRLSGSSLNNTDPLLGLLTSINNTWAYPLQNSSPAIDSADKALCPTVDQSGGLRPKGAGCDSGAIESK